MVGAMLIVDESSGGPIGIFTRQDVIGRIVLPERSLDSPISAVMSAPVSALPASATVADATTLMADRSIRHVPVIDGGRVIGMVTERDLALIETLKDVDPTKVTVEDAMTPAPYTVAPDALLDEVVATMAEHRYGSAVVVDNQHVVGVFTTVDALVAFSDLLHSRLAK